MQNDQLGDAIQYTFIRAPWQRPPARCIRHCRAEGFCVVCCVHRDGQTTTLDVSARIDRLQVLVPRTRTASVFCTSTRNERTSTVSVTSCTGTVPCRVSRVTSIERRMYIISKGETCLLSIHLVRFRSFGPCSQRETPAIGSWLRLAKRFCARLML